MSKIKYRLKYYDYSKSNYYFITINTYKKQKFFGKIVNNEMIYNDYGNLVVNTIDDIFVIKSIEVICFQLMPNHLHMILALKKDGEMELKNAISYFKSSITKKIKDISPLWDRGFYDRVIRDDKEYRNVYEYIINNQYMEKYKW